MKLSEGIREGAKQAEELGIKHGIGNIAKKDEHGNLCLCALGMSLLPVKGVKWLTEFADTVAKFGTFNMPIEDPYSLARETYGLYEEVAGKQCEVATSCVAKKYSEVTNDELSSTMTPTGLVVAMNDGLHKSLDDIADALDSCGY